MAREGEQQAARFSPGELVVIDAPGWRAISPTTRTRAPCTGTNTMSPVRSRTSCDASPRSR